MIEASALKSISGLHHGFFTREGGHSLGLYESLNCGLGSGDEPDRVRRNREVVAGKLGVRARDLVTLYQHHSADVLIVEQPWDGASRPKADAMVTNVPGLALGVLTADCGPILFADGEARIIGAAHAGWKGALNGVADNTILAMEKLGARRERIVAVIGPAISQACYEVGPDLREKFSADDTTAAAWFVPSQRRFHHMFDLPGYLSARIKRLGVSEVVDLAICTYAAEAQFFSYRRTTHRREGDYGRQISAISLAD